MPDLLGRAASALLDASLATAAVAGLVVLAMLQCRQPARRLAWARAGLASTLAMLPLAAIDPVPRFDLRGPLRALWPGPADGAPRAEVEAEMARAPEGRGAGAVAGGLVLAFGAGATVGLAWMVLGAWGSAWVVRRAWGPSASSLGVYRSLPYGGKGPRPRLLVSARASRPVLVGSAVPTILIPPGFDEPGRGEALRLGLLHELAHAEGGDHRFGPLAALAGAIWFFLPQVWWIRRQLRLDQEFLADRRASSRFGAAGDYASSLVELASELASGPDPAPAAGARVAATVDPAGASSLFPRVLMLLRSPFAVEGRAPARWRIGTALAIAAATAAASCLTLGGLVARPPAPSPGPAEGARSFRLPSLVIADRDGDERPFDLRFRLPDRFVLTFEVMAEPSELPALEVLGHRLGVAPGPVVDPSRVVYRLWHRVQVRRASGREDVLVDGRAVADELAPAEPRPPKLATWLTIRPLPGQTTRIRDLDLSW